MPKRGDGTALLNCLYYFCRDNNRPHGRVTGTQPLGRGNDIRDGLLILKCKPRPRSAHASYHLIHYQQNIALIAKRTKLSVIAFWSNQGTGSSSYNGLDHDRSTISPPELLNGFLPLPYRCFSL